MKGKYEKEKNLPERMAKALPRIFGIVVVTLVGFLVAVGICWLFDKQEWTENADGRTFYVVGLVAFFVYSEVTVLIARLRKKRKSDDAEKAESTI